VPHLTVVLRPLVDPAPRLHVEVTASGPAEDLHAWSLGEFALGALRDLSAQDDDGALALAGDRSARGVVTLARPPRGPVRIAYDVPAEAQVTRPLSTMVVQSAMRAAGEGTLVLPVAFDDRLIATSLRIEADALGATGAASTLGIGASLDRPARARALRHAAFIAGQLGTAVFHTVDADDEVAWIGVTAFDPRAAAGEAAIVRSVVETFFGGREAAPFPLLIVGHVHPGRLLAMSRRSTGLLLNVGMAEPWGAAPRIAVAHPLVQKWIGGAVWVGPDDPAHEAEGYWFSEGVARFFAREILSRVGLLEPEELRDSVSADLSTLYTSPRRGERNAEVAAHADAEGALPLLVARGSLYALGLNARIREKTGHKKSLDAVMLALLKDARDGHRRALPARAWIDAVTAELGAEEQRIFEETIEQGRPPPIPEGALGPCFRRAQAKYARFDLGFDEGATRADKDKVVAGLKQGGPAERAGVRTEDVLVSASFEPGWAQGPAKLELTRAGKPVSVTYLPAGESVAGPVWVRKKEVPSEKCKP
jgi:predicted metalloprotease with PDZ domain